MQLQESPETIHKEGFKIPAPSRHNSNRWSISADEQCKLTSMHYVKTSTPASSDNRAVSTNL